MRLGTRCLSKGTLFAPNPPPRPSITSRLMNFIKRLPSGAREVVLVLPVIFSATYFVLKLDVMIPGATMKPPERDLHTYNLRPIYDERGYLKAYQVVPRATNPQNVVGIRPSESDSVASPTTA